MTKKILCYLRPATKEQFAYFVKCIDSSKIIVHCSEHASVDKTGLPNLYYDFLKNNKLKINKTTLSKSEANDFIARCRLLRNIRKEVALKHLVAMFLAIDKMLDSEKPDFVIMQTVDSFITDLLRFISVKRKIKFFGVCGTSWNNNFRVTIRGEKKINKKADKNLTAQLLPRYIEETYIPDFVTKSIDNLKISIYRRWMKSFIGSFYFFFKRYLSGDKYNFHYWHQQILCQQNFSLLPMKDIGNSNWKKKLDDKKKPSLYLPLQMFPEATIDYWCENLEAIKYYETLEKVIKKLHNNFSLFVKEHPDVIGLRPKKFYSKIIKDKRITIIPTYENSNHILRKTDAALVWTGTVGFDAIIRGKPAFAFGKPFYASGKRFLKIDLDIKIKKMMQHISACKKNIITSAEQKRTFRYVTQQLYKGYYKNHIYWSKDNPKDIKDVKQMGSSCKHLFK
ncbi:hypothetical protein N8938_01500 [Candidatus Pelagibacter sp.]|nr:hypothetical protein [Candidatus Pelagibacter sp.]